MPHLNFILKECFWNCIHSVSELLLLNWFVCTCWRYNIITIIWCIIIVFHKYLYLVSTSRSCIILSIVLYIIKVCFIYILWYQLPFHNHELIIYSILYAYYCIAIIIYLGFENIFIFNKTNKMYFIFNSTTANIIRSSTIPLHLPVSISRSRRSLERRDRFILLFIL